MGSAREIVHLGMKQLSMILISRAKPRDINRGAQNGVSFSVHRDFGDVGSAREIVHFEKSQLPAFDISRAKASERAFPRPTSRWLAQGRAGISTRFLWLLSFSERK